MLPHSNSWPMQTILSVEPGGNVSAKLQQVDEPGSRVAPDLVPPAEGAGIIVYKPDIFLALESFRFKPKLEHLGDPIPSPQEMPPLEPVRFYDHFEPLDLHSNEAFVVQVPEPREEKVRLKSDASALTETKAVIEVRRKSACPCLLKEPKPIPEESLQSSSNKLISNYQINILRKSCLRVGRRESSIDLSGSFDKDSSGLRKPFERKLTSEFESVASNNTNTTDCDEKSSKRTQKRSSPAQLIRSYSLGHEVSKRKLNGTFKKFSLPTPASQLKEQTVSGNAATGVPAVTLDSRKVTTLARHYYPEGGWGFVVASCSIMVHVLCHGLQLSAGILISPTVVRFNADQLYAGKINANQRLGRGLHCPRDPCRQACRGLNTNEDAVICSTIPGGRGAE